MVQHKILYKISRPLKYIFLCLSTLAMVSFNSVSQERKLLYDIIKNGKVIGSITFIELIKDGKKFLSFTSDVKTKLIFSYRDHASETAAYENGIMVYSSFYQKTNGSDKANKLTIAEGKKYKLVDRGVSKTITSSPIMYNMLLLYTTPPENIDKVYSDNYQKYLEVKKVGENRFRLKLPDGNYNYYSYNNGLCTRVDIERTLFTIHFELKKNNSKT